MAELSEAERAEESAKLSTLIANNTPPADMSATGVILAEMQEEVDAINSGNPAEGMPDSPASLSPTGTPDPIKMQNDIIVLQNTMKDLFDAMTLIHERISLIENLSLIRSLIK